MQFGMPTLIENRTLTDNLCLCKRLHLNFIELNMNFPEYQIDKLKNSEQFYKAADDSGIYYTIHLDENLNIADFNRLVANAYLETVKNTIESAKSLLPLKNKYGIRSQPFVINMHMNHGIYITLPNKKVRMYERNFDVFIDSFRNFRSLCEEWIDGSDIVIAIENTDGFYEYEKSAVSYLLESPKFALTWDIGHSMSSGEEDVPYILEHSDKLKHFHIHDATSVSDGRNGKNHLALGDGEIDIADKLFIADASNARCVLETKTVAALEKSVEYLKNMDNAETQ